MNKELIKKYKAEFDHWLNDGKLLHKDEFGNWENTRDIWDLRSERIKAVVINDEFVEFSKALAEGKIVQYNFGNYGINRKDFPNTWKDLDLSVGILADRACPENYRIKPEEPKFKVGDWVVNKTSKQRIIKKVTSVYSDTVTVGDSTVGINVMLIKDCELWQPKPGEWCWFYQNKREIPTLGNLKYFSDKDSFCAYSTPKASMSVKYFKHCEPFLGQLPTNLQDIK